MSLFQEACKYIPGGVNSPVRAFRGVGGEPIFFKKARGAFVVAADDRRFIDFVGSWGPMIWATRIRGSSKPCSESRPTA